MIVDTHTHVIARDEARYPLRPSGVGSQWFRDAPCSVDDLDALMTGAGVDAAVLVQAFGAYSYDNSCVLDAAAGRPDRFVSVVIVEARDPAAPSLLRELAGTPAFAGIRLFSIAAPPGPQPTWLDDPATDEVWRLCSGLGLPVVVACLPEHLPRLGRMLGRFPDAAVALDHCGFVDFGVPGGADDLFRLAGHANLTCKVTSHLLEAAVARGDAPGVVDRLAAEFGADRLAWGSDFPQTHDRSYRELVTLAQQACANLSEQARSMVLAGTALRLWPALA